MLSNSFFVEIKWPAPSNVFFACTTKTAGNLKSGMTEDAEQNLVNILAQLNLKEDKLRLLDQQHTSLCVEGKCQKKQRPVADACFLQRGDSDYTATGVFTADCLPLLLCDTNGEQIAAVHAGWRGLAAGVIEETVRHFVGSPNNIVVWLGPAIGSEKFEVGSEVRDIFMQASYSPAQQLEKCFTASTEKEKWMANLYQLARIRLSAQGIEKVYGGNFCTYEESARFFSYRRSSHLNEADSGRMLTLIAFR